METAIIYFLVVLLSLLLYLFNLAKIHRQELENKLYYYGRQQDYRQKRQKIIEHFCIQYMQGKIDLKTTLNHLNKELATNSGGDNDWLQEFKSIKKILLASQEKAS